MKPISRTILFLISQIKPQTSGSREPGDSTEPPGVLSLLTGGTAPGDGAADVLGERTPL
jgi:hypothetical protein